MTRTKTDAPNNEQKRIARRLKLFLEIYFTCTLRSFARFVWETIYNNDGTFIDLVHHYAWLGFVDNIDVRQQDDNGQLREMTVEVVNYVK